MEMEIIVVVLTVLRAASVIALGHSGGIGEHGGWWSSSEDKTYSAWFRSLYYYNDNVARYYNYKERGLLVVCLRD